MTPEATIAGDGQGGGSPEAEVVLRRVLERDPAASRTGTGTQQRDLAVKKRNWAPSVIGKNRRLGSRGKHLRDRRLAVEPLEVRQYLATVGIGDAAACNEAAVAEFPVTLMFGGVLYEMTVGYTTVDGTAKAGVNYTSATGQVDIAAGQTTVSIPVTTRDDGIDEPNETFSVSLTFATSAVVSPSLATATIVNTDPPPTVNISGPQPVNEGSYADFYAALSTRSGYDVTVGFSTQDGTAKAGRNYDSSAGAVTIPAGQTSAVIPVQTIDDHVYEPSEGFSLNLNSATCAALGETAATGTILNIDPPPGASVGTAGSVTEGQEKAGQVRY